MKAASIFSGLAAALFAVTTSVAAEPPAYRAAQPVSGEIRIWANPPDGPLLKDWEEGFRKFHPEVRFSDKLYGPDSTMAGVYTRVADISFLARELREPVERMAFEWVHHFRSVSVEVANAGIGTDRPAANLAVFVNKKNPLARMTVQQLDAIFGAEHLRGPSNIRSWGELGLTGEWGGKPIHVYGPVVDSIPALFFRRAVLKNSSKWNPQMTEIPYDETRPLADSDTQILTAVARDPHGIAFAVPRKNVEGVKMLALATKKDGPYFSLDEQSVVTRDYPLARSTTMVLIRAPGDAVEPKVKEFLRYVLSQEGQAAIRRDGAYIPLSAKTIEEQLKNLE